MILRLYRTSGSVDIQRSDGRDSRRRGGGGRVQRSGGIDGTHGPLIGGGREGGGPSLAGGAPPPPVRVAWQRGRQLLVDPCPRGKCARFSL